MADTHAKTAREPQAAQASKSLRERFFEHALSEKGLPSIGKELAYAVADIRQKLVEEAAYGRTVTPEHVSSIHGRDEPQAKGDPLGRSAGGDPFRERCRQAYERRQSPSEPGDRGPDR